MPLEMRLKGNFDNKFLDKIRFTAEYYPFSFKYRKELNAQLYDFALEEQADADTLSIILACNDFHEKFHIKFSDEINAMYDAIPLCKDELRELFIGLINEQELLMNSARQKFQNSSDEISAFGIQNSEIVLTDYPDNPQNFVAHSETLIEYINTFFKFLSFVGDKHNFKQKINISQKELFDSLENIVQTSGKYYGIKNHFDGVLFRGGNIEVLPNRINFDSSMNGLELIEKVCVTIAENQRLSRNSYYQWQFEKHPEVREMLLKDASEKILDEVKIVNGFVIYKLRQREINDYYFHLNYLVSIHDYYSFYAKEPLMKFSHLTITDFLKLHTELNSIVHSIYLLGFPEKNQEDVKIFKMNFVPKVQERDLKKYLSEVTRYTDKQINSFLDTITTEHNGKLNLYATHLLKGENYFYFPFVPALRPNYYFLIDHWLEKAGEDLAKRGKAMERYLKNELVNTIQREFNKFKLIDKANFYLSENKKEEIDLLIQTKNTLIIGEIKCVKYPMYERDYHQILTDTIMKAVDQLKRKSAFIVEQQFHFSNFYSLDNRSIVEVIITNFPVYTGLSIDGIPIVDLNTFISYFKSGRMTVRTESVQEIEYLEEVPYYRNEDEFCNNLSLYLENNPLTQRYSSMLSYKTFSYDFHGLPTISYTDVGPIEDSRRTYQSA